MIGHVSARAFLERTLPTATILYGPPSVGKWTLATHLADHHHVHPVDRWTVDHGLTIDTVRLITHFAARAPQGSFKLIVARLNDASRPALNAMLKVLEEPPPYVRFLFTHTGKPLATVLSRCEPFELGMLSTSELERVYLDQGLPGVKAHKAAVHARGSVARGFDFEAADAHRSHVLSLMRALAVGDRDQFAAVFTAWDGRSSELLTGLLTEALTQRWHTFTADDACGIHLDRRRLWHMIAALARVQNARPRLGVRAALEPFLARR